MFPVKKFLCGILMIWLLLMSGCQNDLDIVSRTSPNILINANSPTENEQNEQVSIPKKIVIGATFLGFQEAFSAMLRMSIVKEAEQHGIELIVYNGKDSVEEQLSNIRDMIRKKVDIIILNPVDANGMVKGVDLAVKAGIPIIGVNTIVNSDKLISYIGSNDIQAGEMEMQFIADKINGEGRIVILNGIMGQSSQVQRTLGIYHVLDRYPNIHVVEQQSANWSREEAYQFTKKWYDKYEGNIDGIISQNDEMALGSMDFMQKENLKHIPIVGIDAIPEALNAVESSQMDATVFQDMDGMAKLAIDIAARAVQNGQIAKTYFIPFKVVTKENIAFFKKNKEPSQVP